ncbi:hypothetical protein DEO72_LG4g1845 [Vigna unguiculata]|uniref:Uncharacterized protein n=1 Tax=Vigna unguiculata TaxID=3917 RepID=A0A4D6LSD8_VIGUN|nr:hypothetical protein DEO72_LG4g1845 [Vigna unguiculata]
MAVAEPEIRAQNRKLKIGNEPASSSIVMMILARVNRSTVGDDRCWFFAKWESMNDLRFACWSRRSGPVLRGGPLVRGRSVVSAWWCASVASSSSRRQSVVRGGECVFVVRTRSGESSEWVTDLGEKKKPTDLGEKKEENNGLAFHHTDLVSRASLSSYTG